MLGSRTSKIRWPQEGLLGIPKRLLGAILDRPGLQIAYQICKLAIPFGVILLTFFTGVFHEDPRFRLFLTITLVFFALNLILILFEVIEPSVVAERDQAFEQQVAFAVQQERRRIYKWVEVSRSSVNNFIRDLLSGWMEFRRGDLTEDEFLRKLEDHRGSIIKVVEGRLYLEYGIEAHECFIQWLVMREEAGQRFLRREIVNHAAATVIQKDFALTSRADAGPAKAARTGYAQLVIINDGVYKRVYGDRAGYACALAIPVSADQVEDLFGVLDIHVGDRKQPIDLQKPPLSQGHAPFFVDAAYLLGLFEGVRSLLPGPDAR